MKEIVIKVWGSNTYKRSYFNSVTLNGWNLIAPWGAPARTCEKFEVVEVVSGGYTRGDGNHAWEAEYTLRIRCEEGSKLAKSGRQINGSSGYEVIEKKALA